MAGRKFIVHIKQLKYS